MTRRGWAAAFGASPADIEAVVRWVRRARLTLAAVEAPRRAVHVSGSAARLSRLFGVTTARPRAIRLPRALATVVTCVTGFHLEPLASHTRTASTPAPRAGLTPQRIARHYSFPKGADGRGQTIAVIALGGGCRASDVTAYFDAMRLPRPRVSIIALGGAKNDPRNPSGEVTGDVQLAGGLAPGARIAVYLAPNTEHGFVEAVSRAVHDRRRSPSVISISWGRNEMHWVRRTLRHFDDVLAEAAALGISVCCSSGDSGVLADPLDWRPHVCFPASSEFAIACGGTSIAAGTERPWKNSRGASGSGTSALIARPAWQIGVVPRGGEGSGRAIPDVAANADPRSGYRVCFRGAWVTGAGTSASAPLWAALIARLNQRRGTSAGLLSPFLYTNHRALAAGGALVPVGARGTRAPARWHAHTGLGVPNGTRLLTSLTRV